MGTAPGMLAAALWLGPWLRGTAAPDDVVAALGGLAPDAPAAPVLPLVRGTAADRVWPVLPRPGRTLGWPPSATGTPEPAVLLSAGADVVGLVRCRPGGWRVDAVADPVLPSLQAEALGARAGARALAGMLAEAAERLERLGLHRPARGRLHPQWACALRILPGSLDPEVVALLRRVGDLRDVLDLALAEEGAAVTAAESRARSGELRALAGRLEDLACGVVGGLNPRPVAWAG